MRYIKTIFSLICLVSVFSAIADEIPKNDPSFRKRAEELVAKMTLQEKISQTLERSPAIDRLGIKQYNWWNEILHGVARTGLKVTVYPQAIAMAANFDREAIYTMGSQAADEARAIYNREREQGRFGAQYRGLTFWTPNINIFRDPRWGRGQETYGEDPYLTSELGKSIVNGLEGDDPKYLKVSACAKHYAVHSGPESNRHVFDISVNSYDLWNTYLPAFQQLVEEAQVSSVMCAYNRYDGEPCCGSGNLMIDILREKWGFTGYVTSDCGALNNFWRTHKTSPDAKTAAAESIKSGTDLECGAAWQKLWTYNSLEDAVKEGLLDEKSLDESVIRLFEIRMRLGMFDDPKDVPYAQIKYDVVNSPEHKAHALKLARQSMVLLKNNGVLPLSNDVKTIGIVGPNADNETVLLANYHGKPEESVTPLLGVKRRYPNAEVIYTKATDYTKTLETTIEAEANMVENCDVVIFVGGISASLEGEEGATTGNVEGFKGGDRTTIALPRVQTEFMKKLKAMGKKVIFINMSGSAMGMLWESENVDAIIQAWYGGQATGTAIADILSGDYNPSGRLPLTFYKSDSDLPHFEDYLMTNRTYRYFKGVPLYEFGYGLSYTRFEYTNMKIQRSGDKYTVEADVRNAGGVAGDEVVQLYIKPEFNSSIVALKSLRDFTRVSLKSGESCRVKFELDNSDFSMFNDQGDLRLVEGKYSVCMGGAQPSQQRVKDSGVAVCEIDIVR